MDCVHCHGGDATATTQAAAHQHRTAHPIISGDTTTRQQCHADSCAAHVQQFDRIAGISQNIKLAAPIQPQVVVSQPIVQSPTPEFEPVSVLWSLGGVVILAAALGALWLVRRHRSTDHSR